MSSKTVAETREARARLESKIRQDLQNFATEYGVSVTALYADIELSMDIGGNETTVVKAIDITAEV